MIIPAIDIINGQVVRLEKGLYERKTNYEPTPLELAQEYFKGGSEIVHIVDLQGAKDPARRQLELIGEIASRGQIQTGGGVRGREDVLALLEMGVERVVVGSLAVRAPELVKSWLKEVGSDRLVLALDIQRDESGRKMVPTEAWQEGSAATLESILDLFSNTDLKRVLCTDIQRDGMLTGQDEQLYAELVSEHPQIQWQASGGIGVKEHIPPIARTGAAGLIIGKALLEGRFTLKEARQCWQNA